MASGYVNMVKATGESVLYVQNNDSTTINIGDAVCFNPYLTETQGVILANATTEAARDVIGVAIGSIAVGAKGYICTYGRITGVDTSSFATGSKLYLGTSAGEITSTLPSAPNYQTFIGYCLVSAVSGEIFIYPKNIYSESTLENVPSIEFNIAAGISPEVGELAWDADYGTLALGMIGGNVKQQIGEEVFVYVRNQTGVAIPDGSPVYITGAVGDNPTVELAHASGNGESQVCGITTEEIAHGEDGFITKIGFIHNFNTGSFSEGDPLYLGLTPGEIVNAPPAKPAAQVRLGVVVKEGTHGIIFVSPTRLPFIEELNDVDTTGINNGEMLKWNDTDEVWAPAVGWEDLRFPATAINPAGPGVSATYDPNDLAFSFADGQTNSIGLIAQFPHSWKLESEVRAHIHWHPTTTNTGNVFWRMEYKWTNINGIESPTWTTIDMLDAGDGVAGKYQIASFTPISGTGKTLSSIMKIKISRIGSDSNDTFVGAVLLDEFDFHYQIDTLGSSQELVK